MSFTDAHRVDLVRQFAEVLSDCPLRERVPALVHVLGTLMLADPWDSPEVMLEQVIENFSAMFTRMASFSMRKE